MTFATDFAERTVPIAPKDGAGPPSWNPAGRITPGFNLALFAFHAVMGFLRFAIGSEKAKGLSWEGLLLSSTLDVGRFAVVVLISAYFLQAFWRRLVSSLVAVRSITYQEAIAIILMLGILLGS